MDDYTPPCTRKRKRFLEEEKEKYILRKSVETEDEKSSSMVKVEARHHASSSSVKATTTKGSRVAGRRRRSSMSSSDEGEGTPVRWMSEEQYKRYNEQIEKSEGFEVEDFSYFVGLGMIRPVRRNDPPTRDLFTYCRFATKHYKENVNKDAKMRLVGLVRATREILGTYYRYFITFEAKDSAGDNQVKTFQTIIMVDALTDEPSEVELFRLKPTPTPTPTPSAEKVI